MHSPDDMPRRHRLPTGRPRAADPRRHRLRVAVSEAELVAIRRRAGAQRLSRYLRSCALLGSAESAALIDALRALRAEMRGALANLNQSAHHANLLIAAARSGAAGLDLVALEHDNREILALEAEIRRWLNETRETLARITGRVAQ